MASSLGCAAREGDDVVRFQVGDAGRKSAVGQVVRQMLAVIGEELAENFGDSARS